MLLKEPLELTIFVAEAGESRADVACFVDPSNRD